MRRSLCNGKIHIRILKTEGIIYDVNKKLQRSRRAGKTGDSQRISDEFKRRKNDMYAKFYGNKEYEEEYDIRNIRFREHEIEVTNNGITYRTIEDYPEKQQDEEFLLLDKYKECLEHPNK